MKGRNLKLFYLHELLFQFSDSMLALVLPVFIYRLFESVSLVFLFIVSWNLIHGLLFLPVFNVAMKSRSPKYFMMMGVAFYIGALFLFSKITEFSHWLFIPATVVYALYICFYWVIRHWFISINADYKVIGRQMSVMYLIKTIIAFVAPIVGGLVSFLFSFNATFIIGMLAGSLSLIPIALFHAPPHPERFSYKKVWNLLKKYEIKAVSSAYFWEGVSGVSTGIVWILVFAIFIGNILDLGLLVGIATLITGITIWLTGMWFDKRNRAGLLTHVSRVRALAIMLYSSVYFLPNLIYVGAVEFINRLMLTTQNTVLDSYLYAYGNKISSVDFMISREVFLCLSRLLTAGSLAIIFAFLPEKYLWIILFFSSYATLGQINVKNNDHHLRS